MSGAIFWALAAYAMAGLVSGVALGPEWLRGANSAGVRHVAMILPGVCFLGAAIIFRVALLRRGKADAVCWFFSLLAWAAVFGATAQSGAGWLGRWPGSETLWGTHILAQFFALPLVTLAFVATLRMAMASKLMAFKVPGMILSVASGAVLILLAASYLFGVTSSNGWLLIATALSASCLWVARLTPHRQQEQIAWRKTKQRHS